MDKKLYYSKWYFLDDKFRISKEDTNLLDNYYEAFFDKNTQCYVALRYFNNQVVSTYYYDVDLNKDNKDKYSSDFFIVKRLSEFSVLLTQYISFKEIGFELFNFDNNYLEKNQIRFNKNFEMQQFTETFYEGEKIVKEKIFIPSIWNIHIEDY